MRRKENQSRSQTNNAGTSHIAILVDFENIWIGLHGTGVKATARDIAGSLYAYADQLGVVTVAKLYASEPHRVASMRDFAAQGYEVVLTGRSKTSDISMALEAQALLFNHPEISTYLLVSGDSDFAPLAQAIRKVSKAVILVAPRAVASKILIDQANLFLSLEDCLARWQPLSPPRQKTIRLPAPKSDSGAKLPRLPTTRVRVLRVFLCHSSHDKASCERTLCSA